MRRKRATNNRSKGNAGGGDNDDDDNNSNNNNSHDLEDANGADDSYSSFHESSEGGSQKNNGNGGGGGGGGGTSVDNDKEKKQKFAAEVRQVQKIASREQNCMQIFKCMGLFISIAAAILVSTGTYIVLTNEESVDYVENVSEYIYDWIDCLILQQSHSFVRFVTERSVFCPFKFQIQLWSSYHLLTG